MAEKAKQLLHWVPGWIPIIISVASMLVAGGMWYQRMDDHFKEIDSHLQFMEKSMESRDQKIESIQKYLMESHAATIESPAIPAYNVFQNQKKKPDPPLPVKHSLYLPFMIIPAAHSDKIEATNDPHN